MSINSKEKNDIYYFKAKMDGYRARSVYKLLDINEKYNLFKDSKNILDLCAAPGSWTQCVVRNFNWIENVIAVDLQDMEPIENTNTKVILLKEDITSEVCLNKIKSYDFVIDTVICDGAPDVTGFHDLDQYLQFDLLISSLKICLNVSQEDKTFKFVAKMFRGEYTGVLVNHFKKFFKKVILTKPRSSRGNSRECFIIGIEIINRKITEIDFDNQTSVVCETCGFGEDPDYTFEDVVNTNIKSKPVNPPYKNSLNLRKNN